jgi:hypothetical protein
VMRSLWSRPQEQYFIRVSADRPFEELASDAGFRALLAHLTKLGLGTGGLAAAQTSGVSR